MKTKKEITEDRIFSPSIPGLLMASALTAMSFSASAALAQSTNNRTLLDEVIVTAKKRATSIQDVGSTITAITGESLREMGIIDTQDIANATPAMVFDNISSYSRVYLRGVGTRSAGNGLDASVATYVDERYVARPSGAIQDLIDVERVEVLKGPQGTLYGRNATGGVVRLITKDVSDEFEGYVQGTAGNFNAWGLEGVVNAPVSDTFGIRIAAMTSTRDGFQENLWDPGRKEWNDKDSQAIRTKLRWNISDQVTSRLTLGYWQKDDNNGAGIVAAGDTSLSAGIRAGGITGDKKHVSTAVDNTNKGDEFTADLEFDVTFDSFDLQSITTMSQLDINIITDADATNIPAGDLIDGNETSDDYTQEFRLVSNNDSPLQWLAGATYFNGETEFYSVLDVGIFTGAAGIQNVKTEAWSVYGEIAYEFTEQWAVTVGGRWNTEDKEVNLVNDPKAQVPFAPTPYQDKADWNDFTPSVTLEYRPGFGLIYARYAEGFKSGGFNYPPSLPTQPVLQPETIKSYEVGLKADLLEDRLRLSASAFHYDFKDLQVLLASSGGQTALIVKTDNAAEATIEGLEMELTWIPIDLMSVRAGFGYTDGEYDSYPDAAINIPNATRTAWTASKFDASGTDTVMTPKWTAFVQLGYEFRVGEAMIPASVTYSWKDDYLSEFVVVPEHEPLRQDAYGILNARISLIPGQNSNWEMSLWGNNLTDEEYFNSMTASSRGLYQTYAPPRTYGMDVRFNF